MKEKIKIEEIRNYLGTGLFLTLITGEDRKLSINTTSEIYANVYQVLKWGAKPHVRSLFQLTKEIEHNGKKIVPIVELLKEIGYGYLVKDESYYDISDIKISRKKGSIIPDSWFFGRHSQTGLFYLNINDGVSTSNTVEIIDYVKLYNFCYKLHFDVFGWIGKDLAIEKKQ